MWLALISTCGLLTFGMSLAFCLCWKRKQSNSEANGVDGLVMRKNSDESVDHIQPANITILDDFDKGRSTDNDRAILQTTRRSLPDIPFEQEIGVWESHIDNSSEHYATVEQYQNSNKRHTLPNGLDVRPSISQQSSLSQADFSPYEKVNYDKITSRDHPYAQLQLTTNRSITLNSENVIEESGPSQRDQSICNGTDDTEESWNEHNSDIPAASAVAGGIAASLELPYMTPPVLQTNFSGDSQDSSKGYTSISVREPLVTIMAKTKDNNEKHGLDQHYSTVSDDSDDVYTTIPDQNQLYTSESETYARIPIVVEAEINQCASMSDTNGIRNGVYQPDPQPILPSVDSKQSETISHTQAPSTTSNYGSPKPEKRQANSPLPLLPTVNSSDGDKRMISPRSLDELYAKVQKAKTRCTSDEERSPESQSDVISTGHTSSVIDEFSQPGIETHSYEMLKEFHGLKMYGYECIKQFESLTNSDPGYEILKNISGMDSNDEELGNVSLNASYPKCTKIGENELSYGYSVVKKKRNENIARGFEIHKSNIPSENNTLFRNNDECISRESFSDCQQTKCNREIHSGVNSHIEPNYKEVKYLGEPSYDELAAHPYIINADIPGYEQIIPKVHQNINSSESTDDAKKKREHNLED